MKLPSTPNGVKAFLNDPNNVQEAQAEASSIAQAVVRALKGAEVDLALASCALMEAAAALCYAASKEGGGQGGAIADGSYILFEHFAQAINTFTGKDVITLEDVPDVEGNSI